MLLHILGRSFSSSFNGLIFSPSRLCGRNSLSSLNQSKNIFHKSYVLYQVQTTMFQVSNAHDECLSYCTFGIIECIPEHHWMHTWWMPPGLLRISLRCKNFHPSTILPPGSTSFSLRCSRRSCVLWSLFVLYQVAQREAIQHRWALKLRTLLEDFNYIYCLFIKYLGTSWWKLTILFTLVMCVEDSTHRIMYTYDLPSSLLSIVPADCVD